MCCSTVRESERTGGRSAFLLVVLKELYEGFRGGRGGALADLAFGGDSKLMSGADELEAV